MAETRSAPASIGVLTSGGDAPGMNAAVRAVIRTALHFGIDVYAIHEGYQGLVTGGDLIQRMESGDADGILHQGGTAIGTARSNEFRTRDGRRAAARNMVERGIDALVVIGGDGSLTVPICSARNGRACWPSWLPPGRFHRPSPPITLPCVWLVWSVHRQRHGGHRHDDRRRHCLHRIVEAMDALRSTASSHQRTFVVEVMGRVQATSR